MPTTPSARPLLASELFAVSCGSACQGPDQCHWCGAACTRLWAHDDRPPVPHSPYRTSAKHPDRGYVCVGCWLWRRRRVTVNVLGLRLQMDGQCAADHSWWITPDDAWAVTKLNYGVLWEMLTAPPPCFCLSLLHEEGARGWPHLMAVNDGAETAKDAKLAFTVDGRAAWYTVYGLETALGRLEKNKPLEGVEGGVRLLLDVLGPPKRALLAPTEVLPPARPDERRRQGRPVSGLKKGEAGDEKEKNPLKDVVFSSGTRLATA